MLTLQEIRELAVEMEVPEKSRPKWISEKYEMERNRQEEKEEKERNRQEEKKEKERIRQEGKEEKEKERIRQEAKEEKEKEEKERIRREEKEERKEKERIRQEEKEQREFDRRFELEKQQLQFQAQLEMERLRLHSEETKLEEASAGLPRGESKPDLSRARRPVMEKFDEKKESLDDFLYRFETFATMNCWERESWAISLNPLLTGSAGECYAQLSPDEVNNYDELRIALERRYGLTEHGYRSKFKTSVPKEGDTVKAYVSRIANYMERWAKLAATPETYVGLKNLIVREKFYENCPVELASYLREQDYTDLEGMVVRAERYLSARDREFVPERRNNIDQL